MSVYPVLLQNQQKLMTMFTQTASIPSITQESKDVTSYSNDEVLRHRQTSYVSKKTVYTSSALRIFGVTYQKTTKYLNYRQKDTPRSTSRYKQNVISETNELCWASTLLGYGLTWTLKQSYGTIAPSIGIYPVVDGLWLLFQHLMHQDISVIQQKISSGAIHPYMRNADGFSLLHVS